MENTKLNKITYGVLGVLAALMLGWIILTAMTGNEWATMQEGQAETYVLRVADNPVEKLRGLAGTEPVDLGDAIGMVFVYNDATERTFTMKGMNYALDFVWVRDGKIVRIDKNVAAPVDGEDPKQVSSSPLNVDMVIEMPAGTVDSLNYLVGHQLSITLQ